MGCGSSKSEDAVRSAELSSSPTRGSAEEALRRAQPCAYNDARPVLPATAVFSFKEAIPPPLPPLPATQEWRSAVAQADGDWETPKGRLNNKAAVETVLKLRRSQGTAQLVDETFGNGVAALSSGHDGVLPQALLDSAEWLDAEKRVAGARLAFDWRTSRHLLAGSVPEAEDALATLASALQTLAQHPDFIFHAIPLSGRLGGADYSNCVLVRLWRFGGWLNIVTDDLLPSGDGSVPLFLQAKTLTAGPPETAELEPVEPLGESLWAHYLLKALAKAEGSYAGALAAAEERGVPGLLRDFTGGVAAHFPHFHGMLGAFLRSLAGNSLSDILITARVGVEEERATEVGLVGGGERYRILGSEQVALEEDGKRREWLVRVGWPSCAPVAWRGQWAREGERVKTLPVAERQRLWSSAALPSYAAWLSLEEAEAVFEDWTVCIIDDAHTRAFPSLFSDSATLHTFAFRVEESGARSGEAEDGVALLCLTQDYRRRWRERPQEYLSVSLVVENGRGEEVAERASGAQSELRLWLTLRPGDYRVTARLHEAAAGDVRFLLRVFTLAPHQLKYTFRLGVYATMSVLDEAMK